MSHRRSRLVPANPLGDGGASPKDADPRWARLMRRMGKRSTGEEESTGRDGRRRALPSRSRNVRSQTPKVPRRLRLASPDLGACRERRSMALWRPDDQRLANLEAGPDGGILYNVGMASRSPVPILLAESRRRRARILREARAVKFVGLIEYRHVYSQSGGAQYGRGAGEGGDVLTVCAEAFDRDADPEDFSLRSIIAHERGHQLLARHPRLAILTVGVSLEAEEVLASLLGALALGAGPDQDALMDKAAFDILKGGTTAEAAVRMVGNLRDQLRALL